MKKLHFLLLLLVHLPLTLSALQKGDKLDTLTTVDGKTYQSVTIREITVEGISIMHESGVKRIAAKDLPTELQKSLGLDPNLAGESTVKRIAEESSAQRNEAERKMTAIKDLKNTRRIKGKVIQVIQSEKAAIAELHEECYVIATPQDRLERQRKFDGYNTKDHWYKTKDLSYNGSYNYEKYPLCDLRALVAFDCHSDIYKHVCYHMPQNMITNGKKEGRCPKSASPEISLFRRIRG